jgi:hypothetical protein
MRDWTEFIWGALEYPHPTYPDCDVRAWPDPLRAALVAMNILRAAEPAKYVRCPDCIHRHVEPVIPLPGHDGKTRFFIACPEQLRVELTPADLKQWTLDAGELARHLASAMRLSGRCKCLVPSRLWRLGRIAWRGASRDVLLARQLAWKGGRRLAQHIARTIRPIVFVSRRRPSSKIWSGRVPPVIALSDVATFGAGDLELDHDAILAAVSQADDAAEAERTVTISLQQLRDSVLQEVRADQSSALTDDIFVAAYVSEGSYRKAAKKLSEELGRTISKERIEQAVRRHGLGKPLAGRQSSRSEGNRGL